jgi:hypothetical protein
MARRESGRRTAQRQSLHFSVLKVLGRAATDTPVAPPRRWVMAPVRYPSGELTPAIGERGPLAQVVRAHG